MHGEEERDAMDWDADDERDAEQGAIQGDSADEADCSTIPS